MTNARLRIDGPQVNVAVYRGAAFLGIYRCSARLGGGANQALVLLLEAGTEGHAPAKVVALERQATWHDSHGWTVDMAAPVSAPGSNPLDEAAGLLLAAFAEEALVLDDGDLSDDQPFCARVRTTCGAARRLRRVHK